MIIVPDPVFLWPIFLGLIALIGIVQVAIARSQDGILFGGFLAIIGVVGFAALHHNLMTNIEVYRSHYAIEQKQGN